MRRENRYVAWGITAVVVVCTVLLFYDLVFRDSILLQYAGRLFTVLAPVLYGAAMAYLLAPVVNWFERKLFRYDRSADPAGGRGVRAVSILLTWALVALLLYAFMQVLLPELYKSVLQLVGSLDSYYRTIVSWVEALLEDNPGFASWAEEMIDSYYRDALTWLKGTVVPQLKVALVAVTGGVMGVFSFVYNLLIGFIVSVYILAIKESLGGGARKLCYAFLGEERAAWFLRGAKRTDGIFSGFVRGKLLDSLIIGIICFFCTSWLEFPYAPLVSLVVGVTNVIPFFGPFLGAIPSAFLILLDSPIKCLYFVIFIFILQQFDGNILGPKILGDSTGLSSFWVIVSILVGGGLFGVLGMFLAVPTFASVYVGVRTYAAYRLRKRGLPTDTESYMGRKLGGADSSDKNAEDMGG